MCWGYVWDGVNTVRGDMGTDQRTFGADYYRDMMLWVVPAALSDQHLTGPCREGDWWRGSWLRACDVITYRW
jgi:hypothetical protein